MTQMYMGIFCCMENFYFSIRVVQKGRKSIYTYACYTFGGTLVSADSFQYKFGIPSIRVSMKKYILLPICCENRVTEIPNKIS